MANSETFEVSITSTDGKFPILSASLQIVGIDEKFQSLFDRLIQPFIQKESEFGASSNSYPSTTNTTNTTNIKQSKLRAVSPMSDNSPTPSVGDTSSSGNGKFDKIDIKTVECKCFSSLQSKSEHGCNVATQFNIIQTSKRHNFLRIVYLIEIPSLSTSFLPPPSININKPRRSIKKYSKVCHQISYVYI